MNSTFCTPLLAVRLNARHQAWRIPRTLDSMLELVNMPVAKAPGQPGVPLSFVATPGRYLAEMAHTAAQWHRGQTVALLNPAFDLPPDTLALLMAELEEAHVQDAAHGATPYRLAKASQGTIQSINLIVDLEGHILAYVVPSHQIKTLSEHSALRDLSTLHATLDADLLVAMGFPCTIRRVRTPWNFAAHTGLPSLPGLSSITQHLASARLRSLQSGQHDKTWVVLTHHAGDILLALKAIQQCGRPLQGIIVHNMYADIVRMVMPELPVLTVDGPMQGRGDSASSSHSLNDEVIYFERLVLPLLPKDAGFIFLRSLRGYTEADYTLAAQMAFAIGSTQDTLAFPTGHSVFLHPEPEGTTDPASVIDLSDSLDVLQHIALPLPRVQGKRVLLHFDGGWPLKVYPAEDQRALIQLLLDEGCQVSVLGAAHHDMPDGVTFHRFTHLDALRELILANDLLIGMDSFPCHFASLYLEVPTICLYASTRQINLAHSAPDYLAISQGLGCTLSCGSRMLCPRFGGTQCRNFIDPTTVAKLFAQCLVTS